MTRGEGIGAPTGGRETIFITGGKQQENSKQKEEQQTTKKTHKENKNGASKINPAEALSIRSQDQTQQNKKSEKLISQEPKSTGATFSCASCDKNSNT